MLLRAALFGSAVALALILIPVVHFVTAAPSPLIGGYVAGVRAAVTPDRALALGALMAVVLVGPLAGILLIASTLWLGLSSGQYLAIISVVFLFVAGSGGLGAVAGGAHARRQQ